MKAEPLKIDIKENEMAHWMKRKKEPMRLVDPNDPVFSSLDRITAKMTPHERAVWMIDFMQAVGKRQDEANAKTQEARNPNEPSKE